MAKVRCFISFDYDNDLDLKNLLVGQSKNDDSPFEISDWSIKEASPTWQKEARDRIKKSDQVIVICGQHTDTATGVAKELSIAQEEGKSYFYLLDVQMVRTRNRPQQKVATNCTNGLGIILRN